MVSYVGIKGYLYQAMYVILVYDVNQKRVKKVLRCCRKYLTRVQNSVFEGTITEAKTEQLKKEIQKIILPKEDAVSIYRMESFKYTYKESIGREINTGNIL